jgi:peptidyl-Lys metalloendopeptidase
LLLALAHALLAAPIVVPVTASCSAAEPPQSPEMHATTQLAVDRTTFAPGDPVIVHVTIANPGRQPISILRWRTPLDGVTAPLFAVTHDGADVRYVGRMTKRPAPTEADYVTLEPGAKVTADVDLAKLYALEAPGRYTVAYEVTSPQLWLPERHSPPSEGRLTSEPLQIVIEGAAG